MKKNTIAIIAEYNPFHNGHLYQINKIKQIYNDCDIIVIMSGNFTQRCEPALLSKYSRAKQALSCGADCVIELPSLFSTAPAQNFARAGVFIANSLNFVDTLFFSTECGDIDIIKKLAFLTEDAAISDNIKNYLKKGFSYPTCVQKAVQVNSEKSVYDELKKANNMLGIEYIKALNHYNSKIKPATIKRMAVTHDCMNTKNYFASAKFLRHKILNNQYNDIAPFIPETSYNILLDEVKNSLAPNDFNKLENLIFFNLYSASKDNLQNTAYITEGLENRLINAAKSSESLEDLLEKIKTKRYTYSKIRRILLYSLLGINSEYSKFTPQYTRVLGVNSEKEYLLSKIKTSSSLPVVFSGKQILKLNKTANKIFDIENRTADLLSLCGSKISYKNNEFTAMLVKV